MNKENTGCPKVESREDEANRLWNLNKEQLTPKEYLEDKGFATELGDELYNQPKVRMLMRRYSDYVLTQREQDKEKGQKEWRLKNPKIKGEYLCRMNNAYIKMCHWTGSEWLDMWKSDLTGYVVEWIDIPK